MAFTFFFRDQPVIEQAIKQALPVMAGRSRPRIWDAGCAMGPETYTLAILLAEQLNHFAFRNIRIVATDIDESGGFGDTIKRGEYADELLSRIPAEIRSKYFAAGVEPNVSLVAEELRNRIDFKWHDLLSFEAIDTDFSLILCKNVLLHFQPAERVKVIQMFHAALVPGGILAMEQTQKMPAELAQLFELAAPDAQIYRKREQ